MYLIYVIGAMCMPGYIGGCCRHGHSVGERPRVLWPVNASPFVEGHVLQSTKHSARLFGENDRPNGLRFWIRRSKLAFLGT